MTSAWQEAEEHGGDVDRHHRQTGYDEQYDERLIRHHRRDRLIQSRGFLGREFLAFAHAAEQCQRAACHDQYANRPGHFEIETFGKKISRKKRQQRAVRGLMKFARSQHQEVSHQEPCEQPAMQVRWREQQEIEERDRDRGEEKRPPPCHLKARAVGNVAHQRIRHRIEHQGDEKRQTRPALERAPCGRYRNRGGGAR